MMQMRRIGKTHLAAETAVVVLLLVATVSAYPMSASPTTAAAGSADTAEYEQPWLLLARSQADRAVAATTGRNDVLAIWIRTAARIRDRSEHPSTAIDETRAPGVVGRVARTAAAFEDKSFAAALAGLDSLAALPRILSDAADARFLEARRGACQLELGMIAEAEQTLAGVLEITPPETAPVLRCYALLTRGRVRVRTRQVEPPREDLNAARELAQALDIPSWSGTAAIALSVVSRLQMDLDDALQWRQRALTDYRRAGDVAGQARALHYIATIQAMQGDLTRSMTMLQEAVALARQVGHSAEVGGILGEMAGINYLLGNFEQALVEYEEAERLAANPWRRGMMLSNMGSIHEYRGRHAEAAEALQEARRLLAQAGDKRSEALTLTALGKTRCADREFTVCLEILDQALQLAREFQIPMAEAYALATKGHGLLARGDLTAAAETLAAATAVARRIDYFDVLEWSLLGQAQVARRQQRPDEALLHLQEALAEVAERRRRSGGAAAVTGGIVSQAGSLFDETVDLLYELHRAEPGRGLDDQAFAIAQQAKGRAFLDLLTEAEYDLRYSAVPGFREQEAAILSRIVILEQDLTEAHRSDATPDSVGRLEVELAGTETELRLLEAKLRAEEPGYAEVLYPEPLTTADLSARVLAPGEVFLEYALGDSASYLWVVAAERVDFVQLPPRDRIEALVHEVLPLLSDYNLTGADPAWFVPTAHELYQMLLEPVAELLAGAERLIVSPDGILHYLPLEALPTSADPVLRFSDVPFLVNQKVISYTPAVGVLARLRAAGTATDRPASRGWLLVGDPVLQAGDQAGVFTRAAGAAGLPPLPHAAGELAALASLAPGGQAVVLAAADASGAGLNRAAAEADYSLVHFATHGLFNEERPRYSGLVISPGQQSDDDGFLSVSEVLGLRLPCDQVVLSACATALGENITGEGVASLIRSFMFAGARSVVAALWDVSGEATKALMVDYYGRLADGSVGRAAALAAVKRDLATGRMAGALEGVDTSHPAFWAAFVLSGDGR